MEHIFKHIYDWFEQYKRDLPWRKTSDPYKIWVSEIILQQTRVNQGHHYYLRFIKKFPTIVVLANAPDDEVLKAWQGLGYYSRARNLHHSAKYIVNGLNNIFPERYTDIIKLKGIGPYTAAAIASIAFNKPYPTLDGNVYRFLSRFYNINEPVNTSKGEKLFLQIAEKILLENNPGMHNQALMEFGALQCIPAKPDCTICPVIQWCIAYKTNKVRELPVKIRSAKQTKRYFLYIYINYNDSVFIKKRIKNDIWKNLYELPVFEEKREIPPEEILKTKDFLKIIGKSKFTVGNISKTYIHLLSHQKIYAKFIHIQLDTNVDIPEKFIQINKKDIHKFAIPRLIDIFFKDIGLI